MDNSTGWVGMNIDITERKNAEMERDRANTLLTAILDSSPDIISAKDPEGRYLALERSGSANDWPARRRACWTHGL